MKSATELLAEWEGGEQNGLRPQRVQTLRVDLQEHTGQPIPRRVTDIAEMMKDSHFKGVITRELRKAAEAEEGEE